MMPVGAVVQPCSSHPRMIFNSQAALSLAMQSEMEGKSNISRIMADLESIGGQTVTKEENESISTGDILDAVSGNDVEQVNKKTRKRKPYHRHTPQQTQELEAVFQKWLHPDEAQRTELSQRLGLEPQQVKFWFQNRRTQLKTHVERLENAELKKENDKLRKKNEERMFEMSDPFCHNCGAQRVFTRPLNMLSEDVQLKFEHKWLKAELKRISVISQDYLHKPISALVSKLASNMPNSSLRLGHGGNGFRGYGSDLHTFYPVNDNDYVTGDSSPLMDPILPPQSGSMTHFGGIDRPDENLLNLALVAMEELVKVGTMEPLWYRGNGDVQERLKFDDYYRTFPQYLAKMPDKFIMEGTRDSAIVMINSLALVDTLMNVDRWKDMFPSLIASAFTTDIICSGFGGTWNGVIQQMHAEYIQVLSPLVPPREVKFLRFSKQIAQDAWAVVDVSIDGSEFCRRLPSGCIIYDLNGDSKITWVEHSQYNLNLVHPLYRELVHSGMALGAQRWVKTLQRHCELLAIASSILTQNPDGRMNMLKLAERMMHNFYLCVVVTNMSHKWRLIIDKNMRDISVRVMSREHSEVLGEPAGLVLSAATSVWLPTSLQQVFDYLRDDSLRGEWDFLSNGQPMQKVLDCCIPKGHDQGNAISLLKTNAQAVSVDENNMLIVQETCADMLRSMMVYAAVDFSAVSHVMNGGDSSYVQLLPSGFVVTPDGTQSGVSLMTVAFQILVGSQPMAQFADEAADNVRNLVIDTVDKIRKALHCDQLVS